MSKIEINNFRSLKCTKINPNDILALVGQNNSGKSNVLKALELFFKSSSRLISNKSFYNHDDTIPIAITITFENLTDWEKENLESWMCGDKLVVTKEFFKEGTSYKTKILTYQKIPKKEWLRTDVVSLEKIEEWWIEKDDLKINDKNFLDELGTAEPDEKKWIEGISQFLEKYYEEIPCEIIPNENPRGFKNALKKALPEFILIPAIKDVADEAKVRSNNPFGQLINSLFEKIPNNDKEELSSQLQTIGDKLNTSSGLSTIKEVTDIEDNLNSIMCEFMNCKIELQIPVPQLGDLFQNTNIYANDGVKTKIEDKGHGMQRSMIFTILRAYADLSNLQKTENKANERTTIFAIEEPELYLHPQSQRTLMLVLEEIASGIDQVVYCTHSNLFVDISHFDDICIMRMQKNESTQESVPTQLPMSAMIDDLRARHRITDSDSELNYSIRELYSNAFNEMINEGFFASKVIIAEGQSELYSLPIYANLLNYNLDKNNVSLVHSGGKGPIDRLLRIFNGFEIPFYVIFDGDKDKGRDAKKTTLDLLNILGQPMSNIEDVETTVSDDFTVLEFNFEKTLQNEVDDFEELWDQAGNVLGSTGKPLKHRYIAKVIEKRIKEGNDINEELPRTVTQIVDKVKNLSSQDSFLHKLE